MSSFRIAVAGPPLLELAHRAGPRHAAGCAALLDLITTGESLCESLRRELCRLQLSAAGFSVLALLLRSEPGSHGNLDLARNLNLTPQAVSDTLARLEMARLISRVRRTDNRRKVAITLTPEGHSTIGAALTRFETFIHQRMRVLEPIELQNLSEACSRLAPAESSLS